MRYIYYVNSKCRKRYKRFNFMLATLVGFIYNISTPALYISTHLTKLNYIIWNLNINSKQKRKQNIKKIQIQILSK